MTEPESYSQWSTKNAPNDQIDALRNYTDYLRTEYLNRGELNEQVENDIQVGIEEKLRATGTLRDDNTEEELADINTRLFAPKQNRLLDADLVSSYLALDDPDANEPSTKENAELLRKYASSLKFNPAGAVELEGAASELLQDADLVRKARESAVDRGDLQAVGINNKDGGRDVYTGSNTFSDEDLPLVASSLATNGALDTSDFLRLKNKMRRVHGGKATANEEERLQEFNNALEVLSKTDLNVKNILGIASNVEARKSAAEQETLAKRGGMFAVASLFQTPLELIAEGLGNIKSAVTGQDFESDFGPTDDEVLSEQLRKGDVTAEQLIAERLSDNEALRKRFSPEEISRYTRDIVTANTNFAFDAEKPETGIRELSTGAVVVAPALLAKPQLFEASLGKTALNEDQKAAARSQREASLDERAPQMLKLLTELDDDAASAFATAKQQGKTDRAFLEEWMSNEDNYSAFNNRLASNSLSAWSGVKDFALGFAASVTGSETISKFAVDSAASTAAQREKRKELASMFGDDYGLGQQIFEALPQVATDLALGFATAGAGAVAAKGVARAAIATAGRPALMNTARAFAKQGIMSLDDVSFAAFRKATTAGGGVSTSDAIRAVGANWIKRASGDLATKILPVALPAFTRSTSNSYVSIYGGLPEGMSHESKHKQALAGAVATGFASAAITVGMGRIGFGGPESLAVLGSKKTISDLTFREAKKVFEVVNNQGKAVSNAAFQKALAAEVGGAYKNLAAGIGKGVLGESFEEALDQSINIAIEDASLKRETPLAEKLQQVWNAALVGGAIGGGFSLGQQLAPVSKSAATRALEARVSVLDGIAKRLSTSGAPETAASVQRMMDDANAAAAASVKKDTAAAATQAAAATTTAVRTVAEQLEFKFDDPRGVPPADTRLADLIGERVYIGDTGINGIAEIDANTGEVVINFSKPTKVKGKPNVTRYVLGTKFQKATGVTLKPKIKTLTKPVGALPAGTRVFSVAKMEFVLPTVEAVDKARAAGKPLLVLQRDENQRVVGITVRGVALVKSPAVTTDATITDPDLIREVLRLYPAPATPTGGFQLESGEQLELNFNAPRVVEQPETEGEPPLIPTGTGAFTLESGEQLELDFNAPRPTPPTPTGGFALEPADQLELDFNAPRPTPPTPTGGFALEPADQLELDLNAPETEPELQALLEDPNQLELDFDAEAPETTKANLNALSVILAGDPVLNFLRAADPKRKGFAASVQQISDGKWSEAGAALEEAYDFVADLGDSEPLLTKAALDTLGPILFKYDTGTTIRKRNAAKSARRNQGARPTSPAPEAEAPPVAPTPEPAPAPEPEPKPAAKKAARKAAPAPAPAAKKAARKAPKAEPTKQQVLDEVAPVLMKLGNDLAGAGKMRASLSKRKDAREISEKLSSIGFAPTDTPEGYFRRTPDNPDIANDGDPSEYERLVGAFKWASGQPEPVVVESEPELEPDNLQERLEALIADETRREVLIGKVVQLRLYPDSSTRMDTEPLEIVGFDEGDILAVDPGTNKSRATTYPLDEFVLESFTKYLEAGNVEPEAGAVEPEPEAPAPEPAAKVIAEKNKPVSPDDKRITAPVAESNGMVVFERPDGSRYQLLDNSKTPEEYQNLNGQSVLIPGYDKSNETGGFFLTAKPQQRDSYSFDQETPTGDTVYDAGDYTGRSFTISATELFNSGATIATKPAEPEAFAPTPEPSTPPVDPKFRKALSKFVAEYTEDSSANVEWSSDKIESKIKKALKEGYVTQVEHDEALGQLKSRELQEDDTALLASLKSKEDRKDFWESHMDNQRGQALETLYGYAQTTLSRLDPQAGTLSMLAPQDPLRPVLAIIDGDGYLLRNDVIIPDDRGAGQTLAGTELVRFPDGSLMLASDVRGKDVFLDRAGGYVVSLNQIKKNGPVPVTLVQTTRVGERTTWRPTPALTPVTPTFSSGTLSMLAPQGAAVARHTELEAKFNAGTITPEETAEAQRIVESAARAAGLERVYHGTFAGYTPGVAGRANPLTLENLKFPAFFTNSKGDPSYKSRGGLDTRRGTSVEAFARVTEGRTVGSQNQYRNYEPQTRSELESAETFTGVSLDQRFGAQGTLSTLAPQGAVSGRLPGEPTQRTGPLKQEGAMGDADTQLGIVVNRVRNRGRDPVVELQSARKNINSALDKEGLQLDDESAAAFDTAIAGLQNGSDFESVLADLMGSLGYEKFGNVGGSLPMDTVVYDDLEGGMLPGDPALVVTHGYRFPGQSTFAAVIKAGVRPTPEGTLSTLALPDGGSLRQNIADIPAALRGMLPAGFTLVADPNMDGALGYNAVTAPTTVFYNPNLVGSITIGLSRADGMATLRTAVDHELGHAAAEAEFGEEAYAALATELGEDMLTNIASIYYSLLEPDFNLRAERIKADRESGALPDWKIAAEWVRMEIERIANGRTSEQRMLFLRSRPSLLAKFIDALDAFVTRLRARFFEQPTTGTAASISNAARQLRKLKNGGYLPAAPKADPNALGDAAEFERALTGASDSTLFSLPIGAATKAGQAEIDGFWRRLGKRFENLPSYLKVEKEARDGIMAVATNQIEYFQKRVTKLMAKAPTVSLDDVRDVLGRTAPALDNAARARVRAELDVFINKLPADMDGVLAEEMIQDELYRLQRVERIASNTAFAQQQADAQQRIRNSGNDELADLLVKFRKDIDNMSERFKHLNTSIDDNLGVYLTRTFDFFTTEGWSLMASNKGVMPDGTQLAMFRGKEVDFNKLRDNAAKAYEADVVAEAQRRGEVATAEEIQERTHEKLDKYLAALQRSTEQYAGTNTDSIKKDIKRFLPKRDLDNAVLDLLGVIEDPIENAMRTMANVAKIAANDRFLSGARSTLLSMGLASNKPDAKNSTPAFGKRYADAALDPLEGLYTTPEIARALQAEFGEGARRIDSTTDTLMQDVGTWVRHGAAFATTMKTLPSVGFHARNMVSGQFLLTTAQGVAPANKHTLKAFKLSLLANFESRKRTPEQAAEIERLIELQMLRDDTSARALKDMTRGFEFSSEQELDSLFLAYQEAASGNPGALKAIFKKAGVRYDKTIDILASLNNVTDGAVKVQAYYTNLEVLKADKKQQLAQEAADPEQRLLRALELKAADKTKLCTPTHSRRFDWVKSMNKTSAGLILFPFAGWKTEVFRTMYNIPRLAYKEITQGEGPAERAMGVKRLVGWTTVMFGAGKAMGFAYQMIFGSLAGLGDEEDRFTGRELAPEELFALRESMPEWQKGHDVFTRLTESGVMVIDMTAITPYAQLTDMGNIILEGIQTGEGPSGRKVASYVVNQLIGMQIAAKTASEIWPQNQNAFGQPIYRETDDAALVFGKSMLHYAEGAMEPAISAFVRKVTRTGEQDVKEMIVGEFTGARPRIQKLSEIEYRAFRGVKKMLDDSAQIKSSLVTGRKLDDNEVEQTLLKHQEALNQTQRKLAKTVEGLKGLGSTRGSIFSSAKNAGFSAQRVELAEQGRNYRWTPNQAWLKGVYQNMTRTGEDDPMNRINAIRRTLSGQPAVFNVVE